MISIYTYIYIYLFFIPKNAKAPNVNPPYFFWDTHKLRKNFLSKR